MKLSRKFSEYVQRMTQIYNSLHRRQCLHIPSMWWMFSYYVEKGFPCTSAFVGEDKAEALFPTPTPSLTGESDSSSPRCLPSSWMLRYLIKHAHLQHFKLHFHNFASFISLSTLLFFRSSYLSLSLYLTNSFCHAVYLSLSITASHSSPTHYLYISSHNWCQGKS